jgi:hypothetical protein
VLEVASAKRTKQTVLGRVVCRGVLSVRANRERNHDKETPRVENNHQQKNTTKKANECEMKKEKGGDRRGLHLDGGRHRREHLDIHWHHGSRDHADADGQSLLCWEGVAVARDPGFAHTGCC